MPEPSIVAMGGYPDDALVDYVLALAPGKRVLYVPTAAKEDPASTVSWYERLAGRGSMTHLHFFPWPPADLRELALGHDVILVTGGNTANALAIWRTHGFDEILREAWDRGVLLSGWSAGMICWFEHGVTDSFGPSSPRWTASASLGGARVLITTARRAGGPSTQSSSPTASLAASLRTTTSRCTTSARSSARSSRRVRVRPGTELDPTARNNSRPFYCAERALKPTEHGGA